MIEVRNLRKSYGAQCVLDSVSFKLSSQKITGLLGPNACGKTTLIKTLLGLVVPDSGEVLFNGERISNNVNYRQHIGYMQQNPDFPVNLTPLELFRLLSALRKTAPTRMDELIGRFSLEKFLKKPLGTLSAGTRQKVSAIAALMFKQSVLILDEPTSSLDPLAGAILKQLLLENAKDNTTIIIVSHIVLEIEKLAQDLLFMLDGTVLFNGSTKELQENTGSIDLESGILKLLENCGGES